MIYLDLKHSSAVQKKRKKFTNVLCSMAFVATIGGIISGSNASAIVAPPTVPVITPLLQTTVNSTAPFDDKYGSQHRVNIDWVYTRGITSGTSSTKYSPKATVTRESMATFLYRLVGSPTYTPTTTELTKLKDISSSQHKNNIAWLVETGVTSGTSSTTYSPKKAVTREQMATFLYRIAGSPAYTPTEAELAKFKDIADSQHKNNIAWLVKNGVTSGTSATTYSPKQVVTREQMATFLYRIHDLVISLNGGLASGSDVLADKYVSYKAGTDIPAGEYVIIGTGYFEITTSGKKDRTTESILDNENYYNRTILTVANGEYLEFHGYGEKNYLYPIGSAPVVDLSKGEIPEGKYKVGTDFPAGTYTLVPTKYSAKDGGNVGIYMVTTSPRLNSYDTMVSIDSFNTNKSIAVTSGQYLYFYGAKMLIPTGK